MRVFYRLVMYARISRGAAVSTSAAHLPSSEESGDRCGEHCIGKTPLATGVAVPSPKN